jgi:predicted methyltransferase MtxX (methanogen marker protein 4)
VKRLCSPVERILLPEKGKVRVKIVGYLGEDTGPVDTVHGAKVELFVEGFVGEDCFDNVLAVVKGAVYGEVVHVWVEDGAHLCFLDGRYSFVWVEDEDVDILLSPKAVDGGAKINSRPTQPKLNENGKKELGRRKG